MIIPDRFMDLNLSVLRISAIILKQLNKKRLIRYDEILDYITNREGENVRDIFLPALNLLFILGKIEYHLKTDSIEVINEA